MGVAAEANQHVGNLVEFDSDLLVNISSAIGSLILRNEIRIIRIPFFG
jgi:hypothetical protein